MSDLRRVVDDATARLTQAGIVGARADVVRLVGHVLAVDLGEVERRVLLRAPLEPEDLAVLEALLDERAARVPLQHLTGTAPFRGVDLAVGPGVFVPRPETEVVAGLAIGAARAVAHPVVVDLCTGSGAIAVALAREVPGARVHATGQELISADEVDAVAAALDERLASAPQSGPVRFVVWRGGRALAFGAGSV